MSVTLWEELIASTISQVVISSQCMCNLVSKTVTFPSTGLFYNSETVIVFEATLFGSPTATSFIDEEYCYIC